MNTSKKVIRPSAHHTTAATYDRHVSDWAFCMLQLICDGDSVELVFANDLKTLVNHLASSPVDENTRGQIACAIADSLQAAFLEESSGAILAMSETEILALVASRSSDPIERYKIHRPWTAAVPFVAVRDADLCFRVPRGNVVTLDASSDRSLLLSLMETRIIRVLDDGRLLQQ